MFSIPMLPQGGAEEVEIHIYRKDVYLTFCLSCAKLRKFITSTERQSNSRCLRGMFISFIALSC